MVGIYKSEVVLDLGPESWQAAEKPEAERQKGNNRRNRELATGKTTTKERASGAMVLRPSLFKLFRTDEVKYFCYTIEILQNLNIFR